MPKNTEDVDFAKKDQERMSALVAWTEVVPNLGVQDKSSLISFGKRYGKEAMGRRIESLLSKRNLVRSAYVAKIKAKADFLVGMHTIWRSSTKPKKPSLAMSLARRKRVEFVKGFAKRAEPLVRSMLTLEFMRRVVEVYLSKDEIITLTGDGHTRDDVVKLKSLIEQRSGQSIDSLMKKTQSVVEHDFVQMWVANLKDGQFLADNPGYANEYLAALKSGNVGKLTSFYMKGKI